MSTPKHTTREQWLQAATTLIRPLFKDSGSTVPEVRLATGWPSVRGLSKNKKRIGECWAVSAAKDKMPHIFISPWLDDVTGEYGVLATLAHELIHACGIMNHKAGFKKVALHIGLTGKMTATYATPELIEKFKSLLPKLGDYPHGKLDASDKPTKTQTTRMKKCECDACGYTIRVSQKWLDLGTPICFCNKQPMQVS